MGVRGRGVVWNDGRTVGVHWWRGWRNVFICSIDQIRIAVLLLPSRRDIVPPLPYLAVLVVDVPDGFGVVGPQLSVIGNGTVRLWNDGCRV